MRVKKYDEKKFITDAYRIHGDKYDYSTTVYTKMSSPVKISCPSHGEFYQSPMEHIRGKGCPICSAESRVPIHTKSKSIKQTLEDIISMVNTVQKEKEQVGFSVLDWNFDEFIYMGDSLTEAYSKFVIDIFNQKFGNVDKKTIEAFGDTLQTSFDKFPDSYKKQKSSIKTIFEDSLYFHTNMNMGNMKIMVIKLTESLHTKVLFKDKETDRNHGMSVEEAMNVKENNK